MSDRKKGRTLVGLDIGTTKVSCLVAQIKNSSTGTHAESHPEIEVIGIGVAPNTGVRNGMVVNIDSTTEAIRKAREEAELMSGQSLSSVWLGIAGTHVQSFDSKGMVAITEKEVTPNEIQRVIEAAKAVAVPADRDVLHVLPRGYKVDEQAGIWDPIGMSGVRLEANVHIVTGGKSAIVNAVKCTEKAGLSVDGLVLDQLASSLAVVSDDEKNLGVAVVDMGGGTCDVVIYVNGSVAHTSTIPVGGQHFTHDIAVGLRTPQMSAEDLKRKYGCALTSLVSEEETVDVAGVGGRKSRTVMRRNLAEVIEPRAEETLNMIHTDLHSSGLIDLLGSGMVLTGGASQLDGLIEMGEFLFDVPVRRGIPRSVGGLTDVIKSPSYSTSVGLLKYAEKQTREKYEESQNSNSIGDLFSVASRKFREIFGGD